MLDRPNLLAKMQQMDFGYILAPETNTDPLTNLGSIAGIPDAVLKNGASLQTPGLIDGGASALLDGTNDYIDTGWPTRSNLCTNPYPYLAATGFSTVGSTSLMPLGLLPPGLPISVPGGLRVESETGADGVRYTIPEKLTAGKTYTFSAYVFQESGTSTIRAIARGPVGTILKDIAFPNSETLGNWVRVFATFTATESITHYFDVIQNVGTMFVTGFLIEETPGVLPYFPEPTQIASGEAAIGSTYVDIGPFARNAARTFVGVASHVEGASYDEFLGGSLAPPYFGLGTPPNGQHLSWSANGVEFDTWPNVWPGYDIAAMFAVVFDDPADTVTAYVNGIDLGSKAHTAQFKGAAAGSLVFGVGGGLTSYLKGMVVPVGIATKGLSALQIQRLYEDFMFRRIRTPRGGMGGRT